MAGIPDSDYQTPQFKRIKTGATMCRNDKNRFDDVVYGGRDFRSLSSMMPGYDASNPRVKPLKINLNRYDYSLPRGAR